MPFLIAVALLPFLFACGCNKPRLASSRMTATRNQRLAIAQATDSAGMTFTKLAFAHLPENRQVEIPEEMARYNGGRTTLAVNRVIVVRRALASWLQENYSDLF